MIDLLTCNEDVCGLSEGLGPSDFLQLRIDGNMEYSVNGADAACYTAAYSDGTPDLIFSDGFED